MDVKLIFDPVFRDVSEWFDFDPCSCAALSSWSGRMSPIVSAPPMPANVPAAPPQSSAPELKGPVSPDPRSYDNRRPLTRQRPMPISRVPLSPQVVPGRFPPNQIENRRFAGWPQPLLGPCPRHAVPADFTETLPDYSLGPSGAFSVPQARSCRR
jgi:hypothetical protein